MRLSVLLLFALPFSNAVFATDSSSDKNWSNEAEVGFILNRGNTRNTHFDSKYKNIYDNNHFNNELAFSALLDLGTDSKTKETTKTAQKYKVANDAKYKYTEKWFAFGQADYTRDLFSSFDFVINQSVGAGYFFVNNDKMLFSLQSGPGARHSRATLENKEREYINEFIWSNKAKFRYNFSEMVSFTQTITSDFGQKNTNSNFLSELKTQFIKNLGIKLSFLLEYNSNLPDSSTKNYHADTTTSATVVYTF